MWLFWLGMELDKSTNSRSVVLAHVNSPNFGTLLSRPDATSNTPVCSPWPAAFVSSRKATRFPSGLNTTWAVIDDWIWRAEATLSPVERTTSSQPVVWPPPPSPGGGVLVGWKTASMLPSRDQAAGDPPRGSLTAPETTTYWGCVARVPSQGRVGATAPDGPPRRLSQGPESRSSCVEPIRPRYACP